MRRTVAHPVLVASLLGALAPTARAAQGAELTAGTSADEIVSLRLGLSVGFGPAGALASETALEWRHLEFHANVGTFVDARPGFAIGGRYLFALDGWTSGPGCARTPSSA